MKDIEICIPILAALLSVAYPIILQVISQLESKYGAGGIIEYFEKESVYVWFKRGLVISIVCCLLYVITGYKYFDDLYPNLNEHINTFILSFFILSTSSFILLIEKVIKYISSEKLINYLFSQIKKAENQFNEIVEIISDIYCWAISNESDRIINTLNQRVNSLFYDISQKDETLKNGFPQELYNLFYKVSRQCIAVTSLKTKSVESNTIGGGFIFNNSSVLHPKSYQYIWYNLTFCSIYEQDNAILQYWTAAFGYFRYSYPTIQPIYEDFVVINQEAIDERLQHRKEFISFHIALGGLLFYKERVNCINRIFYYTDQQPPNYVLFPKNMTEIFEWYMCFSANNYTQEMPFIDFIYPFPDLDGIEADSIIRNNIGNYILLLFLRQYTLIEYYSFQHHTGEPDLPGEISKCRLWLNTIDYMKQHLNVILEDKILLTKLGFDKYEFFNVDWCAKMGKVSPNALIDNTRSNLQKRIRWEQTSQELSDDLINEFRNSSGGKIIQLLNEFQSASSKSQNTNYRSYSLYGQSTLFDRFAFCKNRDIDYVNSESILGECVSHNLRRAFSSIFFDNTQLQYTVNLEDIPKALEKLKLDQSFVILMFDVNIDYYIAKWNIKELQKDNYKGTEIIHYHSSVPDITNTIFILKREECPSFDFHKPDIHQDLHQEMKCINPNYNIYGGIIDPNKKDLLDVINISDPNLSEKVIGVIDLNMEIKWRKRAKLIQIQIDSGYESRGLLNGIKEIKPF